MMHISCFRYVFMMVLVLSALAIRNEQSHHEYRESKCTFFGAFSTVFLFAVLVAFNAFVDDIEIVIAVQSGCLVVYLGIIWCLAYGTRMYVTILFVRHHSFVFVKNIRLFTTIHVCAGTLFIRNQKLGMQCDQ